MSSERNILIVDDDDTIRVTLRAALEFEGYQVRDASEGSGALRVMAMWQPDIVLLDMQMPTMNGWEFATEMRKMSPPHPVIIVITASLEATRWADQISADAVLAKPFDLDDLLEVVERYTTAA